MLSAEKIFFKKFEKTLAFFPALCYNISHKCFYTFFLERKVGVFQWQNVQFAEKA